MNDFDYENAINTLNTIHFFKSAKKQGYNEKDIEREIINIFNLSQNEAIEKIYIVASKYRKIKDEDFCINYLIEHIKKDNQ